MIQGRYERGDRDARHTGTGDTRSTSPGWLPPTSTRDAGPSLLQQLEYNGARVRQHQAANLGAWDDEVASKLYKSMLYQHVNPHQW